MDQGNTPSRRPRAHSQTVRRWLSAKGERPRLVIVLPLEGVSRIILDAEHHEDELRLREWLRRSRAFEALPAIAARLLDDLDDFDQERAA